MATDVVMPQMGESIAEGTVTRWMKKVGDTVERDEPLFEISTDKVDAEIPSPVAGTLAEILAQEGQTVAVNSVVARISAGGEAAGGAPKQAAAPTAQATTATEAAQEAAGAVSAPATPSMPAPQPEAPPAAPQQEENVTSLEERRRTKSSPLVRKIAKENDIDVSQVEGTGVSGRVTKNDILSYIQTPPAQRPAAAAQARPQGVPQQAARATSPAPASTYDQNVRIEPMSVMRRRIADHMVMSKRTSAHVHTVFEVDFTNVDKLRKQHKQSYAEKGVNLTFLPFIVQAVIAALREFPILNSSVEGENIVYHNDINIGIAVALDWGLIVPVLRHADEKNVLGLGRTINDLGERARTKKLNPEDVQGGTFTITNPGIFGGLFGTPVINQPQVAILGVGGIKKRPVVIETPAGDSIAIRSMCYLALGFDHRIIDGAIADQFMARIRQIIEAGQFSL